MIRLDYVDYYLRLEKPIGVHPWTISYSTTDKQQIAKMRAIIYTQINTTKI